MGSAALASPIGAAFPHSANPVAGASGKLRSAGAAAPTAAPTPRLRRRFLREMDMANLRDAMAPAKFASVKLKRRIKGAARKGRAKRARPSGWTLSYCLPLLNG